MRPVRSPLLIHDRLHVRLCEDHLAAPGADALLLETGERPKLHATTSGLLLPPGRQTMTVLLFGVGRFTSPWTGAIGPGLVVLEVIASTSVRVGVR